MTCTKYPKQEACSFLAINYYEEISNTFEVCLSEALIPENALISNRGNCSLQTKGERYTNPFKKVIYNKEFIVNEADKFQESIVQFSENAITPNDPHWTYFSVDPLSDNTAADNLILHEKEIDLPKEKNFCGKFQSLEVPHIPFTLLSNLRQRPTLACLLQKFPKMEIEDCFEFEDIVFEGGDFFCAEDYNEDIKKLSQNFDDITLEELELPELPFQEIFNSEENIHPSNSVNDFVTKKDTSQPIQCEAMQQSHLLDESTSNQSDKHFCVTSSNSILNLQSIKEIDVPNVKISTNNNNDHCIESHDKELIQSFCEPSYFESVKENNNFEDSELMVISADKTQPYVTEGVHLIPKVTTELRSHSNIDEVCNQSIDFGLISDHSSNLMNVCCYNNLNNLYLQEESSPKLNNIKNREKFAKDCFLLENLDTCHHSLPLHRSSEIIRDLEDMHEKRNLEDAGVLQSEETAFAFETEEINPYLEKISNLHYKLNVFNDAKAIDITVPFSQDKTCCTAVKRNVSSFELQSPSTNVNSRKRKSNNFQPNLSQFNSIDLLSTFMQAKSNTKYQAIPMTPSYASSQSEDLFKPIKISRIVDRDNLDEKPFSNHKLENNMPHRLSQKRNTPLKRKFEGEDIIIKLPDVYINILLIFEDASIPILQTLKLSDQFKFPPNSTLADIPSYKTCFLLNQEVKRCQDESQGVVGKYYICLLAIHGILKSIECLLQYDISLSLSQLIKFEICHQDSLKGFNYSEEKFRSNLFSV